MKKSEIVNKIELLIPSFVIRLYRVCKRFFIWKIQQQEYKKSLKHLREKNRVLRVIFIVKDTSEWKYASVYRLMELDKQFDPIVFVCPQIYNLTEEKATEKFYNTYNLFSTRGYNVIKACENVYDESIDIKSLKPDIIFYSTLWTIYLHPKYNLKSLRKYLKCYVNYGFINIIGEWSYASAFHGLMWRYFAECEDIQRLAVEVQPREFRNIVVTGYPIYDEYHMTRVDYSIWKNDNKKLKRIIWAPHHSIEGHNGLLNFSTFLENAESMLEIAELYNDTVQFAFKPHPMLLNALYKHPKWGKEKTDLYYQKWADGKNTILINGDYIGLFKSSNAMIHDCASFLIEYMYTRKPVLYLGLNRDKYSNIVGKKAYNCHYHGNNIEDIKLFIENVVLEGNDELKSTREAFYNEVLVPPNACSVAENIVKEIKKSIYG